MGGPRIGKPQQQQKTTVIVRNEIVLKRTPDQNLNTPDQKERLNNLSRPDQNTLSTCSLHYLFIFIFILLNSAKLKS